MHVSLPLSPFLFVQHLFLFCVFCLIDRPTSVEMFHPSLSLPSPSISHPITLWDTCEGCGWKVSERDRELRRSRECKRRERKISFALAKNSAGQWTKEVGCGDGSSETVLNCLLFFLFFLTMWAAVKMFFLCGVLLEFQCRLLPHLTNSWLSACRPFSLELLSYYCLRPKILLPRLLFALDIK